MTNDIITTHHPWSLWSRCDYCCTCWCVVWRLWRRPLIPPWRTGRRTLCGGRGLEGGQTWGLKPIGGQSKSSPARTKETLKTLGSVIMKSLCFSLYQCQNNLYVSWKSYTFQNEWWCIKWQKQRKCQRKKTDFHNCWADWTLFNRWLVSWVTM